MGSIYKRELKSFFRTPGGYIYFAVFFAVSGFLAGFCTLESQTCSTSTYFIFLLYAFVILIPLLTMKSFAEEKRMHTEQLLLTAPVSTSGMVLAKYLSALTVFAGSMAVSLVYLVPVYLFSKDNYGHYNFNLATAAGCFIAVLLVGACFIAIGVFVSSLTENQFVAALGTIGLLLVLLVCSLVNSLIDVYAVRAVISWISIYSRFGNFTYGIFDFASALYYVSVAAVFLFLTVRIYDKRRWA